MFSASIRRQPRRNAVFGSIIALALLAGCTGQSDPGSYSDDVKDNFVIGCDGSGFEDDVNAEEIAAASLPTAQCECIYDEIEENIDFDDFKAANSDRRDENSPLDGPEFQAAYDACGPDGPLETAEG